MLPANAPSPPARQPSSSTAKLSSLLSNFESRLPETKLESMGLGTMRMMFGSMWCVGLLSTVCIIMLGALYSSVVQTDVSALETDTGSNELKKAVFAIEGVFRTLGTAGVLLLVLAFPQRTIRSANEALFNTPPQEEEEQVRNRWWWWWWWCTRFRMPPLAQTVLIAQILSMAISPAFSPFGIVVFWRDYLILTDSFEIIVNATSIEAQASNSDTTTTTVLTPDESGHALWSVDLPALMYVFEQSGAWDYSHFSLSLCLVLVYLFPITWFKIHQRIKLSPPSPPPQPARSATSTTNHAAAAAAASSAALTTSPPPPPVGSSLRWHLRRIVTGGGGDFAGSRSPSFGGDDGEGYGFYGANNDAGDGDDDAPADYLLMAKNAVFSAKSRIRVTCAEWDFVFVLLMYFVILLVLGFGLQVNVSIVPLVHLISLLRFCLEVDVNDVIPRNETDVSAISSYMDNHTSLVHGNVTSRFIVRSLQLSNTTGLCSPDQVDSTLFLRVVALSLACFLEMCLIFYIYRVSAQTKMFLTGQNYTLYRKEILEFQFFRALYSLVSFFCLLIGVLSASLNPLENMYITNVTGELRDDGRGNYWITIEIDLDPLFQVGVSFGAVGFGSVFCMMTGFLVWICYTALPVDSFGARGWWCGRALGDEEERRRALLYSAQTDYLVLVPEESTVAELLVVQQQQAEAEEHGHGDGGGGMSSSLGQLLPPALRQGLLAAFASPVKSRARSGLQNQIAGNFLCLETEILLFHFMHLSYVLAHSKKGGGLLSMPEQQRFVEDKRFTLAAHIIDAKSDTHAFVFASQDRIVVAFRGSVSMTNWRTDFDFAEVDCPYAKQVAQPDVSVLGEGNMARAKRVAETRRAVVHRGFVLAYETVRERVLDTVRELRAQEPSRTAVFVTGHSLGGGLGILCTLDLAVSLKLEPDSLSLTTWGCPKMGNFAFIARFFRACPTARRFAMVDDVVTKLPPKKFLGSLTLGGWWHVGTEVLLNSTGQCLIRPTDLERFMFQRTLGNATAHLRMNYATAIMIWNVRSQPDFKADWWVSVISLFNKTRDRRLRRVPLNLRLAMYDSLQKPGAVYRMAERTVRDMTSSTEEEQEDEGVDAMITELLVAYRTGRAGDFRELLAGLQDMDEAERVFRRRSGAGAAARDRKEKEKEEEEEEEVEVVAEQLEKDLAVV